MLWYLFPRFVLLELAKVTLLSTLAITVVLMGCGAYLEASRQGLEPDRLGNIIPWLIPPTLPFTVPTSLLLACAIVFGRLSAQNEITALKSAGIHPLVIVFPGAALAIASSALLIFLSQQAIPACNRAVTREILADLQSNLYGYLRRHGAIIDPQSPYEVYAREVRGERLIDPIFKRRDANGNYDMVTQAAEATIDILWNPELKDQPPIVVLRLIHGAVTTRDGSVLFRDRTQEMPVPEMVRQREDKVQSLDSSTCLQRARQLRQAALRIRHELMQLGLEGAATGDLRSLVREAPWKARLADRLLRKSREAEAEVHLRQVQSLAAIAFVLLGCPVGILLRRKEFLHNFFLCFLPIAVVYYPMLVLGVNLCREGIGVVWLNLWTPLALLFASAIPLLMRVVKT